MAETDDIFSRLAAKQQELEKSASTRAPAPILPLLPPKLCLTSWRGEGGCDTTWLLGCVCR